MNENESPLDVISWMCSDNTPETYPQEGRA